MPDIEFMIKAQRLLCIKKFLDTNPARWKCFFELYLKKVGGKFLFHCNYDLTKLSIALPDFYKELRRVGDFREFPSISRIPIKCLCAY